jgi:MFS family permease
VSTSPTNRGTIVPLANAFYGWYVVAALFFALFLGFGAVQGFGVFVKTWEEDFGVSVGTISVAAAIGVLVSGFSAPLMGRLVDRTSGRAVVVGSLIVIALGAITMSLVNSVIGLIVVYGFVIAFAAGGVSPVSSGAIVARWFERRRGTAISIYASGGSLSGLLLIPFLTYLLIATDWQTAWITMGLLILFLAVPLTWLLLRDHPRDMGLQPDGRSQRESRKAALTVHVPPLNAATWQQPFRTRPIWQLLLTYMVCGITTQSVAVHFIRWAEDEGVSASSAALAFALLSAINLVSAMLVGYFSDRFHRRTLLSGVYLIRGLGFVALIVLPGGIGIWAFALIGGASWLATIPLTQSLTADLYGLRHLGMLSGLIFLGHQIGGAAAVVLFGLAFDAWGSYDVAFAVSAVLLAAAAFGAGSTREDRYSVRYAGVALTDEPPPTNLLDAPAQA